MATTKELTETDVDTAALRHSPPNGVIRSAAREFVWALSRTDIALGDVLSWHHLGSGYSVTHWPYGSEKPVNTCVRQS